eukprot:c12938_g1_i2.p1 GENE.c12938_g1_i2~~c12938_g1_i2.p1  ORF type:complete len:102 (-),score=1.09 c12938_g1_i2:62-367(-)
MNRYTQIVLSFLFSAVLHEKVVWMAVVGAALISSNILFQIGNEIISYCKGRKQLLKQTQIDADAAAASVGAGGITGDVEMGRMQHEGHERLNDEDDDDNVK